MVRQLRDWARSWQLAFDVGGLAGCSVATALAQVQRELAQGCHGAVQQDIAGFFDALGHGLTTKVLTHLRAPLPLVSPVLSLPVSMVSGSFLWRERSARRGGILNEVCRKAVLFLR